MDGSRTRSLDWLELPQLWAFLWLPSTRYFFSWIVAIGAAIGSFLYGFSAFHDPQRRDGNSGHVQVDFCAQWMLARILVEGHGQELYNRDVQRQVLTAALPVEDQHPDAKRSDAESMMSWLMGRDDPDLPRRVGGPLYPPIHPLLHYPLGFLSPQPGYRVMQGLALLLGFVAAGGVARLSRGGIWWPVATTAIIAYPGFSAAVNLGQNPALTVAILIWGWVFLARHQQGWGGAIWGLLAYKPVWALAFFLMLVISGRWRACLAMLASGAALAALTLPLVGFHSWMEWLAVGREAALLYNVDQNWIMNSRDLLSIPRRWMLDFQVNYRERDAHWLPAVIGWALMAFVFAVTVGIAILRRRQAQAGKGPAAAFLLLGAWLTCYHFMYYDVLLTALPVFLLFTDWRQQLTPQLLSFLPFPSEKMTATMLPYFQPRRAETLPVPWPLLQMEPRRVWVLNGVVPTLAVLIMLSSYATNLLGKVADKLPPLETFLLMVLWAWCGWVWLRGSEESLS